MDNSNDKSQTPEKEPHPWHNSRKRFFLPLIFVVVGGLLLARQLGANIPDWIFSWQVLLIGAGLASGIVEKFRGGAWIVMMLVGGFFLFDELVPGADFHKYLWPVGLIAILGCLYLFASLPAKTIEWCLLWNTIGLVIYIAYGRHRSLLGRAPIS